MILILMINNIIIIVILNNNVKINLGSEKRKAAEV